MTQNLIAYWKGKETERNNRVMEAETMRSNLAREAETRRYNSLYLAELGRHNVATENAQYQANAINGFNAGTQRLNAAETVRSNQAKESETNRTNLAKETETARHNDIMEQIGVAQVKVDQKRATTDQARQKSEHVNNVWRNVNNSISTASSVVQTILPFFGILKGK